MTRALISGISGFVGQHLSRHLIECGWDVAGYDQNPPTLDVAFYSGNVCDQEKLQSSLREFQPDVIFHLAGKLKSSCWKDFYETHVLGTISLFEAILTLKIQPRVLVAGSSAVYGRGVADRPIGENSHYRPLTHYAVSKVNQEITAMRYYRAFDLPVVLMRTFNLLGPDLAPVMACSDFACQIAGAEKTGKPSVIRTGSLDTWRDFVDVRDAVIAYRLLSENGRSGQAYNICSERMVSIRECLDYLVSKARASVKAEIDPNRVQTSDVPAQVGSARRIREHTGWQARIPLNESLEDMLNHWRERLQLGAE